MINIDTIHGRITLIIIMIRHTKVFKIINE